MHLPFKLQLDTFRQADANKRCIIMRLASLDLLICQHTMCECSSLNWSGAPRTAAQQSAADIPHFALAQFTLRPESARGHIGSGRAWISLSAASAITPRLERFQTRARRNRLQTCAASLSESAKCNLSARGAPFQDAAARLKSSKRQVKARATFAQTPLNKSFKLRRPKAGRARSMTSRNAKLASEPASR